MRQANIERKTAETSISLTLQLDGEGQAKIQTGLGFMDHMLTLLAAHAGFDLEVYCQGDLNVDGHHTVEDLGICFGQALYEALGDRRGIQRYASTLLPMDEALILTSLDLSGRSGLYGSLEIPSQKVGDFDTELVWEFFLALVREGRMTLHIQQLAGINSHHIIEACFKSLAHSLRKAVAINPAQADQIPSTKGVL